MTKYLFWLYYTALGLFCLGLDVGRHQQKAWEWTLDVFMICYGAYSIVKTYENERDNLRK